jgi:hypothetical protein
MILANQGDALRACPWLSYCAPSALGIVYPRRQIRPDAQEKYKKNPCVLLPQINRSQQSQRSSRQI